SIMTDNEMTESNDHSSSFKLKFKIVWTLVKHKCTGLNKFISRKLTRLQERRLYRQRASCSIYDLVEKVAYLESRLEDVSMCVSECLKKDNSLPIGFCAYVPYTVKLQAQATLNCFYLIKCNHGSGFNASTGVFTAPSEGLYFASITLGIVGSEKVDALVVKDSGGRRDVVAKVSSGTQGTCACATAVFIMSKQDTLYAESIGDCSRPKSLSCFSSFVCFKIK
ncbi:hypothetical protein BgiMline_036347, partial [Biomphalaria glabrata]